MVRFAHKYTINVKCVFWDCIAIIAGVLLALSFSPYDFQYLAVFSLALLFLSWQEVPPLRAALRGFLFGLGLFGAGVSWVYISVHDFGGGGVVSAIMITLLFVVFWSIFPAIAGYLCVRFFYFDPFWLRLGCFSGIWILVEYVRGQWVFNGFPWLQLGYSQLDTPLAGYIPILGGYGVGWLLALTASVLAVVIYKQKSPVILIFAVSAIWLGGYLLEAVQWTQPVGDPIKATMIQGNISQDKKWQPAYRKEIMQRYAQMTRQHWDADIVIWPESAVPAYFHEVSDDFLLPLADEAKKNGTELIVSLPLKNSQGQKFNAVMMLGEDLDVYRKAHLLPFGEYLPLQPFSGWVLHSLAILPVGVFTAGSTDQPLLRAAGYPFITSICYEDAFGEEGVRYLSDAAYLINVTNDGWFGDSIEPYQHMQMARMRALETGRYLLRSTNTGLTAVVSPDGKIIQQIPMFTATALTAEIIPMGGMTVYAEIGDKPILLLLICFLFGAYCIRMSHQFSTMGRNVIR